MTFMPRSAFAELSAGEFPAARASTKYMETFQLSKPALGGTDIRTYPNVSGNLDLYTIGTNDEIYRLRRGENAEAPYHDTNLKITGRQLFLYSSISESSFSARAFMSFTFSGCSEAKSFSSPGSVDRSMRTGPLFVPGISLTLSR